MVAAKLANLTNGQREPCKFVRPAIPTTPRLDEDWIERESGAPAKSLHIERMLASVIAGPV